MPLHDFQCPLCGARKEAYTRKGEDPPHCYKCEMELNQKPVLMQQVVSVPSPMQWGCPKGF